MRISAGKLKGRITRRKSLFASKSEENGLRPTSAKVREAIFDILRPYIDGAAFLDLYAGSGTVGFEALSQGAEGAIFVEPVKSRAGSINEMIYEFGLQGKTSVEVEQAEAFVRRAGREGKRFDIIFADPPYASEEIEKILHLIEDCGILKENGMVLCEYPSKLLTPESAGGLRLRKRYRYGDTSLALYRKEQ